MSSGGDRQRGMQSGDTLRLWDIGGARQIGAWSHEVDGKRESIVDVAMTPNGKRWLFIAFSETDYPMEP